MFRSRDLQSLVSARSSILQPVQDTHSPKYPKITLRTSLSLSPEEVHFLQLEIAAGLFATISEAQRHYIRRGLQAEGKFEDALALA